MSSSARWGGLRPDPYNPNAFDADGDGIVQEGTAFERPAGTRILDEFGRNIASGITSEMRPSNWRVVDRDGRDVFYVPTYQRTRSQPVSNFVGTIGSRVGTIGDRVGTIGDRSRTLESSMGTIISLPEREDVPRVVETPPGIPEYVEIGDDEIPNAEESFTQEIPQYQEIEDDLERLNLPQGQGFVYPAEINETPNMDKVAELISKVDAQNQLVPRAIASAFYTGDFSWIVDQFSHDAAGYESIGGEPDPVEGLSLADIAYAMHIFREDAQYSARRVADDDGMVTVYRGGPVYGLDEPVSVSLDRSDAEEFGDVYAYKVPVSAFEYEPPTGASYANEYLVNPRMMQQTIN